MRTLEYTILLVVVLAGAAWGGVQVAHLVTSSFQSTAALFPH